MSTTLTKRMENPAAILPETKRAIPHLLGAIEHGGLAADLRELVALRASQINGCAACVYGHTHVLRQLGVSSERIDTAAVWRHSPYFSEKEQVALELTEQATRLADRSDEPVSDELWDRLRSNFSESELAALVVEVALINFFNRINTVIQEPAGVIW